MITVLGSTGFVGAHIVKKLTEQGFPFYAPDREEDYSMKDLGDVIYCIGLTADFRSRPFDTVEAHVCKLNSILKDGNFKSLTYLSSTRVYIRCVGEEVSEGAIINIDINDPDEIYTLTKLTGERICLSSGRNVRIARLSNVVGNDRASENFITNIIKQIKSGKVVRFYTTTDSEKDYIPVDVAADLLIKISTIGTGSLYNVAAGENISNLKIIELLKDQFKFEHLIDENARRIKFPRINVNKLTEEFNYSPSMHLEKLSEIIKNYTNDTN